MNKKFNILIPVLGFGRTGGYRVLSKISNELTIRGHNVNFLVPDRSTPYFPTTAKVISIHNGLRIPKFSAVINLLNLAINLRAMERKYDFILANHSFTALSCILLHKKYKCIYYIQAYEPCYYSGRGIFDRFKFILSKMSYRIRLLQVANADSYSSLNNAVNPHLIIPPGIDLDIFSITGRENARPGTPLIIGVIGRAESHKGTLQALTAIADAVNNMNTKIKLHIAYHVPPNFLPEKFFDFRKFIPRNDQELSDFYKGLDILVACGIGQPGAPHYPVMEGMACGAIVVTNGYFPSNSSNAILVEQDLSNLSERILYACSLTAAERGEIKSNGLKAVQGLDWSTIGTHWASLFNAVHH